MEKLIKNFRRRRYGFIIIAIAVTFMMSHSAFGETINKEAENYASQSGCQVSTANPGYSGTGFMDFGGAGSYVEWTISVSAAGGADFSFTYASGDVNVRKCDLIINGVNTGNVDFPGTGGWSAWGSTSKNSLRLNNGNNTIRLVQTTSGGPNVDKLSINFTPDNSGSGNIKEAENFSSQSGCAASTANPGYSGTGFMDYGGNGTWLEWNNVNVASAGNYTLSFRFANGSTANRQCQLLVNGADKGNVAFNGSGGWSTWATVSSSSISLNAGNNTVRLVANTSNGGPNLDKFDITGGTTTDPQAPTTPTNLAASGISQTSFTLTWTASSDNVGVTGYEVFRDGVSVGASTNTSKTISGLTCNTTYSMTVKARDAAGNWSAASTAKLVTTSGCTIINSRVRKLGTNLWYLYSDNGDDGTSFTGAAVFKQKNPDFANTTNPWRDEFINNMKIYQVVRFMDWGVTNYMPGTNPEPPLTTWNQRTLKSDPLQMTPTSGRVIYDQGGGRLTAGIAYEWMMDLCNRIESDMWLCIPHATIDPKDFPNGDDYYNEFVHKLAILVKHGVDMGNVNVKNAIGGKNNLSQLASKDRQWFVNAGGKITNDPLRSDLKVYLEYSNELWMRDQNIYARSKATELGLSSYYRFGCWADIRLWKAFRDVFGNDIRIIRVGGHSTWVESEIRASFNDVYNNAQLNPWSIKPDGWKYNAYVNPGHYASGDPVCGNSSIMESKWYEEISVKNTNNVQPLKQLIKSFGCNLLLGYEGGQHFDCNGGEFARNPVSYKLMWDWANSFTDASRYDLVCHYTHYGLWAVNKTGISSWGAMETDLQSLSNAHKYRGLKDWVEGKSQPKSTIVEMTRETLPMSEKGFYIYPNPSSDGNVINMVSTSDNISSVQLLNLNGQMIGSKVSIGTEGVYQIFPEVVLQPGIYFINIMTQTGSRTVKYIVNQ